MSGRERVPKCFVVKLVNEAEKLPTRWVEDHGGATTFSDLRRCHFADYSMALLAAHRATVCSKYRIRIIAIYTRPKRTAEQERADVVAWLRLKVESESAYRFATGIEQGQHIGAAK